MKEAGVPKIYCVIPVHNRKEITKRCLEYLFTQDYAALHVVIVDDGSTDGTGEYLAQLEQPNLTVLKGDVNLWWGGAMRMGMAFVSGMAQDGDYLLMLNDDVRIKQDYVSTLVNESVAHGNAVVGSAQCDEVTGQLLGCGYRIDFWGMRFLWLDCSDYGQVDTLPGRGVLFPYEAVRCVGELRSRIFPHYFTDLEYTSRVREAGWKIMVSRNAAVFISAESSDRKIRELGWIAKHFSWRSKNNLILRVLFFSMRGPLLLRPLALPHYLIIGLSRLLKRALFEVYGFREEDAMLKVMLRIAYRKIWAPIRFRYLIGRGIRKIVIGASRRYQNSWAPSEAEFLNLLRPTDWERFFSTETLDAILAEHVWEHLSEEQALQAAKVCFSYLKPGGYLRVAVPDGLHPDPAYIRAVRPGGSGPGASDHKVLYTYHTLKKVFEDAGFEITPYEYFDEKGKFHYSEWNPDTGMIWRSARNDPRNADENLSYTSIILDAIKPSASV
jgi:Uncharacterized protein conserved in bacteria